MMLSAAASRYSLQCLVLLLAFLVSLPVQGADAGERFVQPVHLASGRMAVVSEGDLEPRSIGSYAVRLYSGEIPEFPFDDFICGCVKSRDGSVECVQTADVNNDGVSELIVIIRSAGTGGYLAADAWSVSGRGLSLVGHVDGLAADADSVKALAGKQDSGQPVMRCGK